MTSTLTARIAAHPRRALAVLLLFLVVAGALGGRATGALSTDAAYLPEGAESGAVMERLAEATGLAPGAGVVLVVEPTSGAAPDPGRVEEVAAELDAVPGIARVDVVPGDPFLVTGVLGAGAQEETVGADVLDVLGDEDDVLAGGPAVSQVQIGETIGADLTRAELLALPLLVVLSMLFFRGRAAWLPVVVGLTTVLGTMLVLGAISQVYGLSIFALNLVIGLGLGLAIDYTLFLVTRYREELDRHGPTPAAVAATMRTAGRTVVFSAATVAVALATLTVFPLNFLVTMGVAGAAVAVVAALSALLISPALFGLWGARLARRPRRGSTGPEDVDATAAHGRWYRLSHAVMRRPGAIALATAAVMMLLALPALRVEWTPVDETVIPLDQSSRTVADLLAGTDAPAGPLVVALSDDEAVDPTAVATFADGVGLLDGVAAVGEPQQLDATTWQLAVTPDGTAQGEVAQQLVEDVRGLDGPLTVEVGGAAAQFVDQQTAIGERLPLALALLLGLTMLVLWLMTGSVVLPLKAVVMNVLTVGTALGALTFVYQDGRFADLLGYTPNGGIEPTNFLVAAAVVFALSTDYGVFLLGRVKEARDAGAGELESVALGLGRTGAVVTAAAILLAVALGAFSTSSISFIQQIGVATAVGVLVDAFVVRSLLVPSLMAKLGRWNWWSPRVLRRLHDRVGLREEPVPVAAATVPDAELVRTP